MVRVLVLWFNAPPAKIFMGDTGSLSLGGSLGAVESLQTSVVVAIIIVFVSEAISVMVQVISFKLTGKGFSDKQFIIILKKRMAGSTVVIELDYFNYSGNDWFGNTQIKIKEINLSIFQIKKY